METRGTGLHQALTQHWEGWELGVMGSRCILRCEVDSGSPAPWETVCTILWKPCCLLPELSCWPFCLVQMGHECFTIYLHLLQPLKPTCAELCLEQHLWVLDPSLGAKSIRCPPGCLAEFQGWWKPCGFECHRCIRHCCLWVTVVSLCARACRSTQATASQTQPCNAFVLL